LAPARSILALASVIDAPWRAVVRYFARIENNTYAIPGGQKRTGGEHSGEQECFKLLGRPSVPVRADGARRLRVANETA
jgi:hypothetical protein